MFGAQTGVRGLHFAEFGHQDMKGRTVRAVTGDDQLQRSGRGVQGLGERRERDVDDEDVDDVEDVS